MILQHDATRLCCNLCLEHGQNVSTHFAERLHDPGWQTSPLLGSDHALQVADTAGIGTIAERRDSPDVIGQESAAWIRTSEG